MYRTTYFIFRIAVGLIVLAAIMTQFIVHVKNDYDILNFFSYFTNLSNIFAALVLIVTTILLIKNREPSLINNIIRGSATASMILVGITFFLLLRNEDLGSLKAWVNIVLHYIMPFIMLADWLYNPPTQKFRLKHLLMWAIYPITFLTYTLMRGPIVNWYPYPFLNPDKVDGYGGVAIYTVLILILFIAISIALVTLPYRIKNAIKN